MAVDGIPLIVQQTGYVEKLVQMNEQSHAVNYNANQQAATELLERQNHLVQKSDASESENKIKDKEKNRQQQQQQQKKKLLTQQEEDLNPEGNKPEADKENPWAGNIINRKI